MENFLTKNMENGRLKFSIDTTIFSPHIAMKATYAMPDKAYFFFHTRDNWLFV